jgi:hypothetical protein
MRGPVRRVTVYVAPMVSYNCALDIDTAFPVGHHYRPARHARAIATEEAPTR